MPRNKLKKLSEVRSLENVFSGELVEVEERLLNYWGNKNPVILEIGCGQGDYSLNLANEFPGKNFLGIDIKGSRIWTGARNALTMNLKNVAFLITYADKLHLLFEKIKFAEIWIPFPDPFPRNKSIKRRLVNPRFLEIYRKILSEKGTINLKTDDAILYNYAIKIILEKKLKLHKAVDNLYNSSSLSFTENIQTKYEKSHLKEGRIIKFVSFGFE